MKRLADSLIVAVTLALCTVAGVALVGFGLAHAGAMVPAADIRPTYQSDTNPSRIGIRDVRCCSDCGTICGCEKFGDRCRCPYPRSID